jgi:hypothetical protein
MRIARPKYWQGLAHYPSANPVLVTREYSCLKTIHGFKGFCLFCSDSPEVTDFSCCYLREVWVLYKHKRYVQDAVDLAQAIQQSGAIEITVIRLGL